jgi:tRNA (guanine-N7-)-methyltransferase
MDTENTAVAHRPIRSYVLRQGRFSQAQARSHEALMPQYGVAYAPTQIDFNRLFGRAAETIMEIGFGMGETTAKIAETMPDKNFLAVEVHTPGVGGLLKLIGENNLSNIRIIQHDAVEVLNTMIADASLYGLHIYFPDPWPKKRHHKRRLIQPALVHLLAQKLKPDGYIHLATDWEAYALHMLDVLRGEPMLKNTATDFAARPAYRPVTNFERKGVNKGHGVWDIVFTRQHPIPGIVRN